jgi:MarR family transcriptional regulator for hemolysin
MEDSLINLYPFWLERTIRTLKNLQLKKLKQNNIDLTIEQWIVLLAINNSAGASQKEISTSTLKDTANIKRIIDQLIKKSYVKKKEQYSDLRKTHLFLTNNGLEIIQRALPIMDSVRKIGLTDVTEKEFDYLVSTLKKIYHNLS